MRYLFFRADGNARVGSGHIQRCLSIADAAKSADCTCVFICADESYFDLIERRGYACHVLRSDYRAMEQETPLFLPLIERMRPEAIVVDSYFVTGAYLNALRQYAKTIYLDDEALIAHPTDVLVNYNLGATGRAYTRLYSEAGVEAPRMLLGTEYAPLRAEFSQLPGKRQKKVRHILFLAGGTDPERCAYRMTQRLREDDWYTRDLIWHVVVGALSQDREALAFLASGAPWLMLHENVEDMATLMRRSDVAVSAAGSTMYELAACSTPTIAFVCADNQKEIAAAFAERGMALYAGDCRGDVPFENRILERLERLREDSLLRRTLARRARAAVDGDGAKRLAGEILS